LSGVEPVWIDYFIRAEFSSVTSATIRNRINCIQARFVQLIGFWKRFPMRVRLWKKTRPTRLLCQQKRRKCSRFATIITCRNGFEDQVLEKMFLPNIFIWRGWYNFSQNIFTLIYRSFKFLSITNRIIKYGSIRTV
jgi:hypothetical protein